jgi:predicted lipid-binding transport protein (Tim44 family)
MRSAEQSILAPLGQLCRTVAATLIAGVWRRRSADEVEARIKRLGLREQTGVVGGVLGMMFLCSLFAAQFGVLGLLGFLLLVVLIVN